MPWPLPTSPQDRVDLAKSYPFFAPDYSYWLDSSCCLRLEERLASSGKTLGTVLEGRTPVVGHGSNRSPEQLKRKYQGHDTFDEGVVVTGIWLEDHDVVFSSHMARYGSVAADLAPAPGVSVQVFVNWLTPVQLEMMHKTESSYSFIPVEGNWSPLDWQIPEMFGRDFPVYYYKSNDDPLKRGGQPISIAAIPSKGRQGLSLCQEELLALVHQVEPEELDRSILRSIDDQTYRHALMAAAQKTFV
ncbi:hypothetical protein [Kiloniella sp. b19]|uniref:hypothetical protein n=1 Tax=Kiloniella sp. GXU_MW_B19 TaxID=3141326 RepID=UPI0031D25F2A